MSKEVLEDILMLVINNTLDGMDEVKDSKDDYYKGKKLAYYEVLDSIKNQLIIYDADLEKFGLDIDLDNY